MTKYAVSILIALSIISVEGCKQPIVKKPETVVQLLESCPHWAALKPEERARLHDVELCMVKIAQFSDAQVRSGFIQFAASHGCYVSPLKKMHGRNDELTQDVYWKGYILNRCIFAVPEKIDDNVPTHLRGAKYRFDPPEIAILSGCWPVKQKDRGGFSIAAAEFIQVESEYYWLAEFDTFQQTYGRRKLKGE